MLVNTINQLDFKFWPMYELKGNLEINVVSFTYLRAIADGKMNPTAMAAVAPVN